MKRTLLLAMVGIGVLGCQSIQEVDLEAEKAAVAEVMDQINRAWETEDLEAFSRLVVHDEDMVSFGADVGDRWVGWSMLQQGLQFQFEAFAETKVDPQQIDIHVSPTGQTAWLAQAMEMRTSFMGSPLVLDARITGVFEKREDQWRMVQFHYSVPMSQARGLSM
jgi:uncharacterized protein (TIGR02246 family)